jgi:hypothetical protein
MRSEVMPKLIQSNGRRNRKKKIPSVRFDTD